MSLTLFKEQRFIRIIYYYYYLTYVALHEVTWCMAVWCTHNAPRQQQWHVAPAMWAPLSTQVRCIFRNTLWKASYSCRITCKRNESARERKIALYKTDQQQHTHALLSKVVWQRQPRTRLSLVMTGADWSGTCQLHRHKAHRSWQKYDSSRNWISLVVSDYRAF